MKRNQRWNKLRIWAHRDPNTGGSDMWSSTLPLDHGGAPIEHEVDYLRLRKMFTLQSSSLSSSAMISPLQDGSLRVLPPKVSVSCSRIPVHIAPQYCCSSSLHIVRCLRRFLLLPTDVQAVSAALHLLSVLRLMWPAHVHFLFAMISIMSISLVWSSPNC